MLSSSEMDDQESAGSYLGQLATYLCVVAPASVLGSWDALGGIAVALTFAPAVAIIAGARVPRSTVLLIAGVLAMAALLVALAIASSASSTASLLLLYVPPVTIPLAIAAVALSRRR